MSLGNQHGRGDDKILREHGRSGRRHFAGKNREIERAGFLQPASGRRESKSARERRFGEGMLHVGCFAFVIAGSGFLLRNNDFADLGANCRWAGT
jgi:hypothetical protein